uniref:Alternative protein ATG2B n=1 Tax=Homo sapiens TaxID=9606 RepID=L8E8U7_HUMAN|nr:alternative protein ATG2B [Homo sapiens]
MVFWMKNLKFRSHVVQTSSCFLTRVGMYPRSPAPPMPHSLTISSVMQ